MIINFNKENFTPKKNYDYCIVGAGLIGIVIANEITKMSPKVKILLIEYGNNNYGHELSSNIFESPHFINNSIVNGIGGCSNTWSQTLSTFSVEELKHFRLTKKKFQFFQNKLKKSYNLFCSIAKYKKPIFKKSKKIFNTKKYLNTSKYDTLYNCYAKYIKSQKNRITSLQIISVNKKYKLDIQAQNFILTSNSYSIIQILLNSIHAKFLKIKNSNIGKKISNHPILCMGYLLSKKSKKIENFSINNNYDCYYGFRFLKNNSSHLSFYRTNFLNFNLIYNFLKELIKKILLIFNIKMNRSFLKIPFVFKNIYKIKYLIFIFLNMKDKESKAELSKKKNKFGSYFLHINFKKYLLSNSELIFIKNSLKKQHKQNEFIFFDKTSMLSFDNAHHIGGTIMGQDKDSNVVDYNFRYHGLSNLYILSKSIFPISSSINPTYHLLILALILVENLVNNKN